MGKHQRGLPWLAGEKRKMLEMLWGRWRSSPGAGTLGSVAELQTPLEVLHRGESPPRRRLGGC